MVIRFAELMKHLSGKGTISYCRGERNTKCDIMGDEWNLILPSNTTLKEWVPPIDISGTTKNIRSVARTLRKNYGTDPIQSGLKWDEIAISEDIEFSTRHGKIYGIVDDIEGISDDKLLTMSPKEIKTIMATHICQFYISTLDGKNSLPVYSRAVNNATIMKSTLRAIELLTSIFEEYHIKTVYTCSDGWKTNLTVSEQYQIKLNRKVPHFYDFLHLCKLLRNSMLTRLMCPAPGQKFSALSLEKYKQIYNCELIISDMWHPTDKMDQSIIQQLCDPEITNLLIADKHPEYQNEFNALGNFLKNIYNVYHTFLDNENTENSKFRQKNQNINPFR